MIKQKNHTKTSRGEPKVYSYIRFSTPDQALGDSERRQLEAAQKFAKGQNMILDETMIDRGFSAHRGKHKRKGHLGRFIERIENEEIPKGSILVIENTDRLSREPIISALDTFTGILKKDVLIQTLFPSQLYTLDALNSGYIYQLIGQMQRAHDESQRKSERVRAARRNARKKAREENKILTKRVPAWLLIKNDTFDIVPGAKETIQLIFDLKLKGTGKNTIAKRLNEKAAWKPSNVWRTSYIQKILQNRAVLGEYQPYQWIVKGEGEQGKREPVGNPISDYYPRVINDETFFAVQEMMKENRYKGGRNGKASNLFVHLVKCPYCGGSMTFVYKGKPPKSGSYLVCDNGRTGRSCARHSIRYDEVEDIILKSCRDLKPEQVLPNPDEQSRLVESFRNRLRGLIAKQKENERQIDNYDNQIGRTDDPTRRDRYEAKAHQLEQQNKNLEEQIEVSERELHKAQNSLQSFEKWQKDMKSLQKMIKKVEIRERLRYHLREIIDRIDIFSDGLGKNDPPHKVQIVRFKTLLGSNRVKTISREKYEVFFSYVKEQCRESKVGRFLRIYFKSGSMIEIVPKGSIPYEVELWIDENGKINWRSSSSQIKALWNKFNSKESLGKIG